MWFRSGGDRLRQTRLIPRSPDGDKKKVQIKGREVLSNFDDAKLMF